MRLSLIVSERRGAIRGVCLDVDGSFCVLAVLALLWALVIETKKPPDGGCCGCLFVTCFSVARKA